MAIFRRKTVKKQAKKTRKSQTRRQKGGMKRAAAGAAGDDWGEPGAKKTRAPDEAEADAAAVAALMTLARDYTVIAGPADQAEQAELYPSITTAEEEEEEEALETKLRNIYATGVKGVKLPKPSGNNKGLSMEGFITKVDIHNNPITKDTMNIKHLVNKIAKIFNSGTPGQIEYLQEHLVVEADVFDYYERQLGRKQDDTGIHDDDKPSPIEQKLAQALQYLKFVGIGGGEVCKRVAGTVQGLVMCSQQIATETFILFTSQVGAEINSFSAAQIVAFLIKCGFSSAALKIIFGGVIKLIGGALTLGGILCRISSFVAILGEQFTVDALAIGYNNPNITFFALIVANAINKTVGSRLKLTFTGINIGIATTKTDVKAIATATINQKIKEWKRLSDEIFQRANLQAVLADVTLDDNGNIIFTEKVSELSDRAATILNTAMAMVPINGDPSKRYAELVKAVNELSIVEVNADAKQIVLHYLIRSMNEITSSYSVAITLFSETLVGGIQALHDAGRDDGGGGGGGVPMGLGSSGGGRRNTRRNTRNKRKKNRGTTKKRRRKSK